MTYTVEPDQYNQDMMFIENGRWLVNYVNVYNMTSLNLRFQVQRLRWSNMDGPTTFQQIALDGVMLIYK